MFRASSKSLVWIACAAIAACSASQPPPPPPGAPSPPPPMEGQPDAKTAAPATTWAALRDQFLFEAMRDEPSRLRELGLHEGDGKISDYGKQAISDRIERLKGWRSKIAASEGPQGGLSENDALDRAIVLQQIELALFQHEDLNAWRKNPRYYEELFAVNVYLDRDYAPLTTRAEKLIAHEKAAIAAAPNVIANLEGPMSKPVVETAIKVYKGYVDYLKNDVPKQVKDLEEPLKSELLATNAALAAEAAKIADHLEKTELPRGDDSHVLGPEKYKKLLRVQEGLTLSLADFKARGEANLRENKAAYEALRKKVKPTRPKAKDLLAEATKLVESSRALIEKKQIVTIPANDKAIVRETPPFMRWNSAFLDAPGPFEKNAKAAFYFITMPDPTWPKKEQEEYLMTKGVLLATSVHEVYPGHFLHGLWIRRAPTTVQATFGSYSFTEGWAHYAEQMMIEEGFGKEDPQNKLGQLSDALLRNCRYVVSIGIHTEGMTLEQAAKRFEQDCFQDKATARQQAARGTFDPGYFAYTLGKIQILELREEAKKALGAGFTLRKFHDALLGHGAPPIPLVRNQVLAKLGAQ